MDNTTDTTIAVATEIKKPEAQKKSGVPLVGFAIGAVMNSPALVAGITLLALSTGTAGIAIGAAATAISVVNYARAVLHWRKPAEKREIKFSANKLKNMSLISMATSAVNLTAGIALFTVLAPLSTMAAVAVGGLAVYMTGMGGLGLGLSFMTLGASLAAKLLGFGAEKKTQPAAAKPAAPEVSAPAPALDNASAKEDFKEAAKPAEEVKTVVEPKKDAVPPAPPQNS